MIASALVLAGSRGRQDPVATYANVTDKALIPIGGETMLSRVLGALAAAGIQRTVVSANAPAVLAEAEHHAAMSIAAAAGPSASTAAALARLGAPLLVTTADHALLRPEWIAGFLGQVQPGVDVAVLLARRETIERAAPGSCRTYLRFSDGDWSGCNLFLLATPRAQRMIELWQEVERDRKRPWRIVWRLGPTLLARYLLGRLALSEAVAHLGRRAGIEAIIVEASDGLAAVDVDKPEDLDFVRALVGQASPVRDLA